MASVRLGQINQLPPIEGQLPLVAQLVEAADHAARAALLLRLSDDVLIQFGVQLQDACLAGGFKPGADFIAIRIAQASAVRDPLGELPERVAAPAELWRRGMVAIAAGGLR